MSKGFDDNAKDEHERTVIHYAVQNPNITTDIIKYIISNECDVNSEDKDHATVLHYDVQKSTNVPHYVVVIMRGVFCSLRENGREELTLF